MNKKLVAVIAGVVIVTGLAVCLVIVTSALLRNLKDPNRNRVPTAVVSPDLPVTPPDKPKPVPAPVEPEPRAIDIPEDTPRFDLAYRGLTFEKDTLRYYSGISYGMGGNVQDNDFIAAVRKRAQDEISVVYFPEFLDQVYSAVEYKGTDAKKFYFDVNGDGAVSDDEIIGPVNVSDSKTYKQCDFITPDFVMTNRYGQKIPFRARLEVSFWNGQTRPQTMWSPASVHEGTGQFNGKDMKFILYTSNLDGRFMQWGRAQYSLMSADTDENRISRATLSSLVYIDGKFYQLRLEGGVEEGQKLRVVLVEDNTPTGKLAVKLEGKEEIDAGISYAYVNGKDDKTIRFSARNRDEYPANEYTLTSGQFSYGTTGEHDRSVDFSEGPSFAITADNTETVTMGDCEISIKSVDENKRYHSDVQDLTEFDSDMNVFLSLEVRGAGGEMFTRFKQKNANNQYMDVKPHMTITDAKGKTVESKDLEYG